MFIKERHLVPLLVLIATTFLLFLSTRKSSCVREGLQNTYHKVEDEYQNIINYETDDSYVIKPVTVTETEMNIINNKSEDIIIPDEPGDIVLPDDKPEDVTIPLANDLDLPDLSEPILPVKEEIPEDEIPEPVLKPKTNPVNLKNIPAFDQSYNYGLYNMEDQKLLSYSVYDNDNMFNKNDSSRCRNFRYAVKHLNENDYIKSKNVNTPWNKLFKKDCGVL